MRALSFLQPWVYAMFVLGKDVENRVWRCPDWMVGQPFLIHTSAGYDRDGHEWLEDQGYEIPPEKDFRAGAPIPLSRSAIVGRVIVTGSNLLEGGLLPDEPENKWAFGPHVWHLSEMVRFEEGAHHIKGALNFWQVDPYVIARVHDQLQIPVHFQEALK